MIPPNSDPCPELDERLGAGDGDGAGVEMERINPKGVLAAVVGTERADFDLRIGVVEQEPLVEGLVFTPCSGVDPAIPSSLFPPSLAVRDLGKLCRGVGEALELPKGAPTLAPKVGSVRGRRRKPTWLGGGLGWWRREGTLIGLEAVAPPPGPEFD